MRKLLNAIFGPSEWETKYYALVMDYAKLAKEFEDLKAKAIKPKVKAKKK